MFSEQKMYIMLIAESKVKRIAECFVKFEKCSIIISPNILSPFFSFFSLKAVITHILGLLKLSHISIGS